MARYPGFTGPSNTQRSRQLGQERTINLYSEPNYRRGFPGLLATPGLTAWTVAGSGPIRAMFELNGRAWVVSGQTYYELYPNRSVQVRGFVVNDGLPATIHSNGTAGLQNMIISGGKGYIHNTETNVFGQISDPDFVAFPSQGFLLDTYFGVVARDTTLFKLSNLANGQAWDGLDLAQRTWGGDNIISAIVNHRELWLLGAQTSEVWVDIGDASFPFAPIQGVFIEGGSAAVHSAAQLDNTIFWLYGDSRGHKTVRRANGYTPERVSTFGMEEAINAYPRVDDAIGWTYTQAGHAFYCLEFPSANETTWVYDVATGEWAERAQWNTDTLRWEPRRSRFHMLAWGKHLVGDRASGTIYELRLDAYQDTVVA